MDKSFHLAVRGFVPVSWLKHSATMVDGQTKCDLSMTLLHDQKRHRILLTPFQRWRDWNGVADFLTSVRDIKKRVLPSRVVRNVHGVVATGGNEAVYSNEIGWRRRGISEERTIYCKRWYPDIMVIISKHKGKRDEVELNGLNADILKRHSPICGWTKYQGLIEIQIKCWSREEIRWWQDYALFVTA